MGILLIQLKLAEIYKNTKSISNLIVIYCNNIEDGSISI